MCIHAIYPMDVPCEEPESTPSGSSSESECEANPSIQDDESFVYQVGDIVSLSIDGGFYNLDSNQSPEGKGVLTKPNGIVIEAEWKSGILYGQLIVVNMEKRALVGVYTTSDNVIESSVDLSQLETKTITVWGSFTWEGSTLNNKPYGWGKLYNRKSLIAYEGFMIDTVKVCYGRIYNYVKDLYYEGTICNSAAHGAGKLVSPSEEIIYDGGFFKGLNRYSRSLTIPPETKEIEGLTSLIEELTIGNDCCRDVTRFSLSGLVLLRSIEIGENCFQRRKSNIAHRTDSMHAFFVNLQALESLVIGKDSFCEFCTCELRGLPLLNYLSIGDSLDEIGCFINCFEFVLDGGVLCTQFTNRHTFIN